MRCFVTVGTTHFDELVEAILSEGVISALADIGIQELSIQYGRDFDFESKVQVIKNVSEISRKNSIVYTCCGVKIRGKDYYPSIVQEMRQADLIIGHAGAGTCMEALSFEKPLVIVVNNKLMNNHQVELAERLSKDNYAHVAYSPAQLENLLRTSQVLSITKFPRPVAPSVFSDYIDNVMKFT